jgi:hypothetical protein
MGWEFPNSFFLTVGITTIVWLLVTFITKPESTATLTKFYERVRPDGNWKIISDGKEKKHNNIPALLVCWVSSVVLAYGVLFTTGKVIFKEWQAAGWYFAAVVIAAIVLSQTLKRTSIWD